MLLAAALAATRAIDNGYRRALVLAELATELPQVLREPAVVEALADVAQIDASYGRAHAAGVLAPFAPVGLRGIVLRDTLAIVAALQLVDERAQPLAKLAPLLPADLLGDALAIAASISGRPPVPEPIRFDSRGEVVDPIDPPAERASAIATLASFLPDALLPEALRVAAATEDPGARAAGRRPESAADSAGSSPVPRADNATYSRLGPA